MNKRLLFILIFIVLFFVFFLILKDHVVGIIHFGWKTGDEILARDLYKIKKIEFVDKSDGTKIEFNNPNDIDEILSLVSLKGMSSKTTARCRYDLKFYTSDDRIVIINLGNKPILEGFSFKYTDDFKKLFSDLREQLSQRQNRGHGKIGVKH
jgi:hypothetical protein